VGCEVFSVRKGLGFFTGDFSRNDGRGGWRADGSPASPHFADENHTLRHAGPGVLTMANSGAHTNGSVFMVSLAPTPHLGERAASTPPARDCNRVSRPNAAVARGRSHPPPRADGRNLAFGRVLTGLDVARKIGGVFTVSMKPATRIAIAAAGRLAEGSPEWEAVDKALAAAAAAATKAATAAAAAASKVPAKAAAGAARAAAAATPGSAVPLR